MTKPILVVTSHHMKAIEERIDHDYNARRNPNRLPLNQPELLTAAEGANALFITQADRLSSEFFQRVSRTGFNRGAADMRQEKRTAMGMLVPDNVDAILKRPARSDARPDWDLGALFRSRRRPKRATPV